MKFGNTYFTQIVVGAAEPIKLGELTIDAIISSFASKLRELPSNTNKIQVKLSKQSYLELTLEEEVEASVMSQVGVMDGYGDEWLPGVPWSRHFEMIDEDSIFWKYQKICDPAQRQQFNAAEIESIKFQWLESFSDVVAAGGGPQWRD